MENPDSQPQSAETRRFADAEALAAAAAAEWWARLDAPRAADGTFRMALSGGRTAEPLFSAFVKLAAARPAPLANAHVFWADERCVPPDDPESNYQLAGKHLLRPLSLPEANVHRIPGELPPADAARLASAELDAFASSERPLLDLVLLGMGEDGHVASLFPANMETDRRIATAYHHVRGPKPPPDRITLGYGSIFAAREVWVLISGSGKAQMLRSVLGGTADVPLARLLKNRTITRIFADCL